MEPKSASTSSRAIAVAIALVLLSGCDLGSVLGNLRSLTKRLQPPSVEVKPTPTPTAYQFTSEAAKSVKANMELLSEMMKVIYMEAPRAKSEFVGLVNSLNQGASLEGIYNGFIHSTEYRRLAIGDKNSSPEALKVFGEELAELEAELPVEAEFDITGVSPTAGPAPFDSIEVQEGVDVIEFENKKKAQQLPPRKPVIAGTPSPSPSVDRKALAERYSRQFVGASIFTLKKVLGDEALKVIAHKREYKEKLALWYSRWVVRLAARKVDFGLELRNKPDEHFHYKWAIESPEDRLKWEVLNRLHRLLNEANQQKGP